MASLLFFISFIIIIQFARINLAQQDFLNYFCSNTKYTTNSTYKANLNSLLSSISSNTEIDHGFYNFSSGQNSDKVYAIALCRGDITVEGCRNCINDSTQKLTQLCPNKNEAIGWYDYCMLRYAHHYIFHTMETSPSFYRRSPNKILDSDIDQFNATLGTLLANLRKNATLGGSIGNFALGEANYTSHSQKIYALVQCTPDISRPECDNCLERAIDKIPTCCNGKQGGRVVHPSCNLRYSTSKFYEPNTTTSTPPPSTKGTKPP